MSPPSEYLKQRSQEARLNLARALQFAHDNVVKPEDKQTLVRMLDYLKLEPGEASPAEIKFFSETWNAFKRRGLVQDLALAELHRRENAKHAAEDPTATSTRVVLLRSSQKLDSTE